MIGYYSTNLQKNDYCILDFPTDAFIQFPYDYYNKNGSIIIYYRKETCGKFIGEEFFREELNTFDIDEDLLDLLFKIKNNELVTKAQIFIQFYMEVERLHEAYKLLDDDFKYYELRYPYAGNFTFLNSFSIISIDINNIFCIGFGNDDYNSTGDWITDNVFEIVDKNDFVHEFNAKIKFLKKNTIYVNQEL